MHLQRRIWSFLLPVLTFFSFKSVLLWPKAVFFVAPGLLLLTFLAIFLILGRGLKTPSSRFNFGLSPVIFYLSSFALFFLLEEVWMQYVLVLLGAILIGFFFESLYIYVWEHESYEAYSLENISGYLNSLSAFFSSSALLGLVTFLQIPAWSVAVPIFIVYFFLSWQTFWVAKMPWRVSRYFVFVAAFILLEIFFVFSLLPIHFLVAGAVSGIFWYTLVSLSRAYLLGFWTRRLWLRYFVMVSVLIGVLLVTTRWI